MTTSEDGAVSPPEITFGTYNVRAGFEGEFESLVARNWATLRSLGFIEDEQPQLYRSTGSPRVYVEQVRWRPGAVGPAHEHPDLIPVWERLRTFLEPRTNPEAGDALTFAHFVPVALAPAPS